MKSLDILEGPYWKSQLHKLGLLVASPNGLMLPLLSPLISEAKVSPVINSVLKSAVNMKEAAGYSCSVKYPVTTAQFSSAN